MGMLAICELPKNAKKHVPVVTNSQESQFLRYIVIVTVRTLAFFRAVYVQVHRAPRSYDPPFCRFTAG
jgi:hypothetical protein